LGIKHLTRKSTSRVSHAGRQKAAPVIKDVEAVEKPYQDHLMVQ